MAPIIEQVADKLLQDIRLAGRTPPARSSIMDAMEEMLGEEGIATLNSQTMDVAEAIAILDERKARYFAKGEGPSRLVAATTYYSAIIERPGNSKAAKEFADHILKYTPEHAPALNLVAAILLDRCKFGQAQPFVEKALAAARRNDLIQERILAQDGLARIHMADGEKKQALALLIENLELALQANLSYTAIGDAHGMVGWVCFCDEDHDRAADHDREAISAYESAENDYLVACAYQSLSTILSSAGRGEDAVAAARNAVEFSEKAGDPKTIATNLDGLTRILMVPRNVGPAAEADVLDEAEANTLRALAIYRKLRNSSSAGIALESLSLLAERQQDRRLAIERVRQAIAELKKNSIGRQRLHNTYQSLGRLLDLAGNGEEADRNYARAIKIFGEREKGDENTGPRVDLLGARFLTTASELDHQSKYERAERVYRHVLEATTVVFPPSDIASVAAVYAVFLAKQNRPEEARRQAARARGAAAKCEDDSILSDVENELADNGL